MPFVLVTVVYEQNHVIHVFVWQRFTSGSIQTHVTVNSVCISWCQGKRRRDKCAVHWFTVIQSSRGRNSSVGSAWARCPQCHGFDPPQGTFSGRGDFSLGVNMGSNSIPPQNSFGWEYKPRSSLCTHAFHRMDSKDPDVHVLDGWMPATKTHPACTIHEDGMWLP